MSSYAAVSGVGYYGAWAALSLGPWRAWRLPLIAANGTATARDSLTNTTRTGLNTTALLNGTGKETYQCMFLLF